MHSNDRIIVFLGIIIVVIALIGAAIGGTPKVGEDGKDDYGDYRDWPLDNSELKHITGISNENSDETIIFNISLEYVTQVFIEFRWLDEAEEYPWLENQPDSFNFTIHTPWEQTISSLEVYNSIDTAGVIEETVAIPEEGIKYGAVGEWTIVIHCGECGNQEPFVPDPFDTRTVEDDGNAWTLNYHYEFHTQHQSIE